MQGNGKVFILLSFHTEWKRCSLEISKHTVLNTAIYCFLSSHQCTSVFICTVNYALKKDCVKTKPLL